MRIAIDIDGVLADQLKPTLAEANEQFGVEVKPNQIETWDEPIPGTPTDIKTEIEAALERPDFVRTMPMICGAAKAIQTLKHRGHTLVIATNRPERILGPTQEWLSENDIPFDELHSTEHMTKADIPAEVLIDDYYRNIEEFTQDGRCGILFQRPYNLGYIQDNSDSSSIRLANGWDEVLQTLRTCIMDK